MLGEARYVPWDDVIDVYPASYEVAGSFLSPFASSAGTLVHSGIAIDRRDGRRHLLRFTPGTIRAFRAESRGFTEAMAIIRDRFARKGQPMVTTARAYTDAEILSMQAMAREPLVSISSVFFAFFLPPVLLGAIFLAASSLGIEIATPLAVSVAFLPPAIAMGLTLRRSVRRNAVLSELWKHRERLRTEAAQGDDAPRSG